MEEEIDGSRFGDGKPPELGFKPEGQHRKGVIKLRFLSCCAAPKIGEEEKTPALRVTQSSVMLDEMGIIPNILAREKTTIDQGKRHKGEQEKERKLLKRRRGWRGGVMRMARREG